jgi:hypothetical protein
MIRLAAVAAALALVAPGGRAEEPDVQKAIDAIAGTWVCIEEAGKKPDVEIMLVIDKKGRYRMAGKSGEQAQIARLAGVEGQLRLSPGKNPPQLSVVGDRLTVPGLYKLEGERLVFLLSPDLKQPESFEKTDGTFHIFARATEKK